MDSLKHQQFAERVVRNQHRVFGYIVSLVPNRADAEEMFQQTCLTLWENWERYDATLEFVPWACGFAHNHVRNFYRKAQNSQAPLDPEVLEMLAERSCELRQEDDRLTALRDCLAKLSADNRHVVEGYYAGKTVEELAVRRAATPNAIYKLLHRLRVALHDCVSLRLAGGVAR
jgi:RNA polymerase sigma-70 factor (ECF subfamily)